MAEIARERPKQTKSKPKKSKPKPALTDEPAPVPECSVASAALHQNIQHGATEPDIGCAQVVLSVSEQFLHGGADSASRPGLQDSLFADDLEVDSSTDDVHLRDSATEDVHVPVSDLVDSAAEYVHIPVADMVGLVSHLQEDLTLQCDPYVHPDGDPERTEDMLTAKTGECTVDVENESVPTADLLHLDPEGVPSQDQSVLTTNLHFEECASQHMREHQCEESAGGAASSVTVHEARLSVGDAVQTDFQCKEDAKPASSLSALTDVGSSILTTASVFVPGLESSEHAAQPAEIETSVTLAPVPSLDSTEYALTDPMRERTTAASDSVPSLEAVKCAEHEKTIEASAPMPSLESTQLVSEHSMAASAPVPSLEACAIEPVQEKTAMQVLPPSTSMPAQPSAIAVETHASGIKMGMTEKRRVAESSLYPKVPVLESHSKFQPMTEEQLQQLYYNPQLQANEAFIEDFIQKEEKTTTHEFYEIVMNYFHSRKNLLNTEEELQLLKRNYDQILTEMWIVNRKNITVEGQCADGSRVSKTHTVEQCELNVLALTNMKSSLHAIRFKMQGDLALFAYSSQMSRLQVESYLHLLFSGNSLLRDMPKNAPVTAVDHTREDLLPQVQKVRDCISVLFVFHRKPTKDVEFVENIRKWTDRLVAALLRVASYADHLFMLNHVLRAPSGVGQWGCGYVQVPGPASLELQTTLGSRVLDHAVTCLATILLPVRARTEFMCQMKTNVTEQSIQMAQTWILVDSDGEEDEDPSQAWLYLHENDVVAILQQLPLHAIFTHILQAPVNDKGTVHYDISRCTEPSLMKLFAFCTTWISLLGVGLNTYSMARYKNLNKRLGSLIRQTVTFVSDHLLNFREYYSDLVSSSSLDHLQLEFDQLFMRATYTILTAQKLGSWQFMAEMPFTSLSSDSIWRLLWLLQQVHGQPVDFHTLPPVDRCKEDMKDIESRRQLADTLQRLHASESIYLLTTFANMAISRPLEEDEFIECITLQVFEIAFICNHTRDFCSKTGRSLLSSVIQKHPTALSMLLRRVQGVMAELGKMSLYLFSELPASIWIPQDPDMVLLRQWLLNNDLDTPENLLARCVISRMNWDLFTETGKLVLDIRLHRQMALLLVESYMKYISDRRASFFIIEGMKQMASYAYTTSQGSREQQFNNWVWSIALRLKLHHEAAILHSRAAEARPFRPPSLKDEQWLLPLASAARAKSPLACFLVLSMTDVGHDTSQFIVEGLDMLQTLAQCSQFSCVVHVLSCVTPMFISTPQYLLENGIFLKVLQMLLSADESVLKMTKMAMGAEFKAGTVTHQFTQMIQASISAHLEHGEALATLLFWVQAIFKVSNFLIDMNCCYVLDHLVRWAYLQKGARDNLEEVFRQYYKQLQSESKLRGGFLTWVGGGSASPPSLMERASMPEFGWLAMQVLSMEDDLYQESGVWPALQQELLANPSVRLDIALKHVMTRLKPEYPCTVGRLCLYRWAQQALDMPVSHPMMPLMWQRFFSLYFGRCAQQGQLPRRASVGERFFQSMTMSSMLKRLRKKLAEAADFHINYEPQDDSSKNAEEPPSAPVIQSSGVLETDIPIPSPLTEESPQYSSSKEFHNQLARLYQTFCLWLDEPRLHGADLYLPSLPAPYEAHRLMQMFAPSKNLWLEFVDFEGAQYDITLYAAEWRKIVSGQPQCSQRWGTSQLGQRSPRERILHRLQRYTEPLPPPALQPVVPPVPDIAPAILTDRTTAIHLLDSDLSILCNFTKVFSTRAAQQCAVDSAFLDLIPGQYTNATKIAKVLIECHSRVNPLHRCTGPAIVSLKVDEREVNLLVQRKLDENRAEYKQLNIESELPPPQNICIAAVHVENAITLLINLSRKTSDPERRRTLCDVACILFFHLTMQVCEETNFYLPTRQFFSSCVEILGKEFVSQAPEQTPLLLQFCLDNQGLAEMVAPHFVPNNSPQHFLAMYEQLITALQQQNLTLVFMLLTKFDVHAWLENIRPPADDRKRFLEILGNALMSCGAEPSAKSKLVFDLYLSHLRVVLKHQFPVNLTSVLILLLQGSSNEALHTRCWEMFLMECCTPLPGSDPKNPVPQAFSVSQVQACSSIPLSTQQLEELLKWLGVFFSQERQSHTDMVRFGLYPHWGRYVPYVSLLLGLLSRSFVSKVLAAVDSNNPFDEIRLVWLLQLEVWQAWMEPLPLSIPSADHHGPPVPPSSTEVMLPWTEQDSTVAVSMVEAFRSTLMFTHDTLASVVPQFSSFIFSLLLIHYMSRLCQPYTPPHITDVLMGEFSQLPWEQLRPDLQLLDMMTRVKQMYPPSCFQLIGHVLTRVRWREVVGQFRVHHDPQHTSFLLQLLLLLLVQCYGDPLVRELPEVAQLLTSAETFDWTGLTREAFHSASLWFLQVCEPAWILAQRSSIQALGFRLLKRTADFNPEGSQAWTKEMSEKRLMYVHCLTRELCQVTYQASTDPEAVCTVLVNLLSEVESMEAAVPDARCRDEESLDVMKEVLSLLNNSNPSGEWQAVLLQTVCQWLLSSPHSVLLTPCIKAASRCLASLAQMVQVMETCIHVYFTSCIKDNEAARRPSVITQQPEAAVNVSGWDHILSVVQVPELSLAQYTQEALRNGSFLVLYALLLHQRSLCQAPIDEARLMDNVLEWTTNIAPNADNEAKLLLWWQEFCRMWLHQLDSGASVPLCVVTIQRLIVLLHQLGEDRATTGFFGIIGLGRRSPLSPQFRLVVRSMAAFLSSQVLNETTLRFQATSPLSELPMAKNCRSALSSLRTNRLYASFRDTVESMIGFVHRTDHTARNVLDLIAELCITLYSHCDYLKTGQGERRACLEQGSSE